MKNFLQKLLLIIGAGAMFLVVLAISSYLVYLLTGWNYGSFHNFLLHGWAILKIFLLFLLALLSIKPSLSAGLYAVSRHRPVNLFISHHHKDESMALDVREAFEKIGFATEILTVEPRNHDDVVSLVRQKMKNSDAIIAIPPLAEQSFSQAEILAASYLEKPMMFIVDKEDRQLSTTALKGYPVFKYDKLHKYDFVPIGTFLNYIFFHKNDVSLCLKRSWNRMKEKYYFLIFVYFVVGSVLEVLYYIDPNYALISFNWFYKVIISASVFVAVAGILVVIRDKIRVTKIVRQLTITGGFTYDTLANTLSEISEDMDILDCLEKEPLQEINEIKNTSTN